MYMKIVSIYYSYQVGDFKVELKSVCVLSAFKQRLNYHINRIEYVVFEWFKAGHDLKDAMKNLFITSLCWSQKYRILNRPWSENHSS